MELATWRLAGACGHAYAWAQRRRQWDFGAQRSEDGSFASLVAELALSSSHLTHASLGMG